MRLLISKGFTLFELIISVAIISVISIIGITSYQSLIANQALSYRADQIYYTLKFAQSEAIKRNTKIYVHFCEQQSAWKMGISESPQCDCFTSHACQLDSVEKVQDLADGNTLLINSEDITFTGNQASYSALRFKVETCTITLTNSENKSLSIIQGSIRLRVCAPEIEKLGYPKC